MASKRLRMTGQCKLTEGRLVLGFTGWMDGGDTSTGTVKWLVTALNARQVGQISPQGFYLYSFPGSMELAALFRPEVEIEEGTVKRLDFPSNTFYCDEAAGVLLFIGKEPNLDWVEFADCLFTAAQGAGVTEVYFVGSYGGAVPHTREPRLVSTISDERLKPEAEQWGLDLSNYEGPASFATYLTTRAGDYGLRMMSVVAEIPSYIEGANPKCIQAVIRKLAAMLALPVNLDDLRKMTDAWERRLSKALNEKPDLAKHIRKLEEDYDNEVFDTQMSDLKAWLQQQGLRVD